MGRRRGRRRCSHAGLPDSPAELAAPVVTLGGDLLGNRAGSARTPHSVKTCLAHLRSTDNRCGGDHAHIYEERTASRMLSTRPSGPDPSTAPVALPFQEGQGRAQDLVQKAALDIFCGGLHDFVNVEFDERIFKRLLLICIHLKAQQRPANTPHIPLPPLPPGPDSSAPLKNTPRPSTHPLPHTNPALGCNPHTSSSFGQFAASTRRLQGLLYANSFLASAWSEGVFRKSAVFFCGIKEGIEEARLRGGGRG